MSDSTGDSCAGCRFFRPHDETGDGPRDGECRRRVVPKDGESVVSFLGTFDDDWCGEFEPRPNPAGQADPVKDPEPTAGYTSTERTEMAFREVFWVELDALAGRERIDLATQIARNLNRIRGIAPLARVTRSELLAAGISPADATLVMDAVINTIRKVRDGANTNA